MVGHPPSGHPDFHDGLSPRPSDIFIAVMGVTGVGKSTFISHCTQKRVEIGNDLEACTQEVAVYSCHLSSATTVYLVDTPGFDDTSRSDSEVLKELAQWLTASYAHKIKLNGIIYLHRITDIRMQGSAIRNLVMFKKLCGDNPLQNVVLATTMWEDVDQAKGKEREAQLMNTPNFWGQMLQKGSQVVRHTNDRESALRLIKIFANKRSITLNLQAEMVDQGKDLYQTTAGIELEGALARERARFKREMADAQADMFAALELKDRETAEMLRKLQEETSEKIRVLDHNSKELKIDMERLHQQKYQALEDQLRHATLNSQKLQEAFEISQKERERELRQHNKDTKRRNKAVEKNQPSLRQVKSQATGREPASKSSAKIMPVSTLKSPPTDDVESFDKLYGESLIQSVLDGDWPDVRFLLAQGAPVNWLGEHNYTALHQVAKTGNVEIASRLLDHGANIDAITKWGSTPLHMAVGRNEPMVRLLLERGARCTIMNSIGDDALETAMHYGNVEIIDLVKKFHLEQRRW